MLLTGGERLRDALLVQFMAEFLAPLQTLMTAAQKYRVAVLLNQPVIARVCWSEMTPMVARVSRILEDWEWLGFYERDVIAPYAMPHLHMAAASRVVFGPDHKTPADAQGAWDVLHKAAMGSSSYDPREG